MGGRSPIQMGNKKDFTEMLLLTPPAQVSRAEDRRSNSSSRAQLLGALTPHGERRPDRREGRDRRATPRVRVEVECEERRGTSRYFRITEDLSAFGLSTRQGQARPLGTRVSLALFLPDDPKTPVLVQGQVVGPLGLEGGMRLAFRRPSAQAVRRIHRFLSEHTAR